MGVGNTQSAVNYMLSVSDVLDGYMEDRLTRTGNDRVQC